jgi:hypothetical protein
VAKAANDAIRATSGEVFGKIAFAISPANTPKMTKS